MKLPKTLAMGIIQSLCCICVEVYRHLLLDYAHALAFMILNMRPTLAFLN